MSIMSSTSFLWTKAVGTCGSVKQVRVFYWSVLWIRAAELFLWIRAAEEYHLLFISVEEGSRGVPFNCQFSVIRAAGACYSLLSSPESYFQGTCVTG